MLAASRSGSLSSSMKEARTSFCPTIKCEEALRRELEYRKRLEVTHPNLLIALNGGLAPSNEMCAHPTSGVLKRKPAPEINMPSPQSSFSFATARIQPANWQSSKKKVAVPQSPSQALQIPRTNSVPSFWCKICKVDCVTEFNFNSHIGGKKHKAKKIEILGNRTTGRPGIQFAGNMNPGPNDRAVSGSRNYQPNVGSSSIAGPSSNMSSGV